MPRRRVRGSGIAAFLLDEHIPRDFEKLLDAFGHSVAPARGLGLQGTSDVEFLRAVVAGGWDALISLDLNRQPEVWSQLMLELVEGRGRLVRLKPRSKEVPTIAVLARHWSLNYEELARLVADSRYVLIQVGMDLTSQRRLRGGVRGYTRVEVGAMVQQSFNLAPDGTFRVLGTPRLRPPTR